MSHARLIAILKLFGCRVLILNLLECNLYSRYIGSLFLLRDRDGENIFLHRVAIATRETTTVSVEKERKKSMSNISVDSVANSTRERCIRVAVIDIMTIEGNCSSCVQKIQRRKRLVAPCSLRGTYEVNVR